MTEFNLTTLLIVAFLVAILLGWIARWGFDKLNLRGPMASQDAMNELRETQATLHQKTEEFRLIEEQYARAYAQLEADLEAAMAGLGEARRELQEIKSN